MLLNNDIKLIEKTLINTPEFLWLEGFEVRQRVIAEMAFNLGFAWLMAFKKMWGCIKDKEWNKAADEMMNSLWAKQVGQRADRLAKLMRYGVDFA